MACIHSPYCHVLRVEKQRGDSLRMGVHIYLGKRRVGSFSYVAVVMSDMRVVDCVRVLIVVSSLSVSLRTKVF
jgi:hypothetical protein